MDKHGLAALLLMKPKKDGAEEGEKTTTTTTEESGDMSRSELKAHFMNAAHEMLDAIKSDDAEKLAEAFSTMHRLDHPMWDKEDAGEPEDDEEEDETEEEPEEEAAE